MPDRLLKTTIFFLFLLNLLHAQDLSLLPEARGIWMDRDVVRSGRDQMNKSFKELADANFNRVFINVHYHGSTIYPSEVIENAGGLRQLPEYSGRDPLQEAIEIAHYHGLELVAWSEYGLMVHYSTDTSDSGPIVAAHPDWEQKMANGQHWETNIYGDFHWIDPGHPEVSQFLVDLFGEMAANYPELDAIETDRIRYPSQLFSYNEVARQRYMDETGNSDPIDYLKGDKQWPDWYKWREQQTTNLARRIHQKVKSINPAMLVESAVGPPYMLVNHTKIQNWKIWADSGYVDALEPMIYVNDADLSNQISLAQYYVPANFLLYTGIGPVGDASLDIQLAKTRSAGVPGITLWYSGNFDTDSYNMLRNKYFSEKATLPHNDLLIDNKKPGVFDEAGSWKRESGGFKGNYTMAEAGDGSSVATWTFQPVKSEYYQIFARWTADSDRATDAQYKITSSGKETSVTVDQQQNGDSWYYLTADSFKFGQPVKVSIDNNANGRVVADAVRLVIPDGFSLIDINTPDSTHLELRFSREVKAETAADPIHYEISGGIQVYEAVVNPKDNKRVTLTTSEFAENVDYSVIVRDLIDSFDHPLTAINGSFNFQPSLTLFEIDNNDATFKSFGTWEKSSDGINFFGDDYLISPTGNGENRAQWWAFINKDGYYEISARWPSGDESRATTAAYSILHQFGVDTVYVDQQSAGDDWHLLGTFSYQAGAASSVLLSNNDAGGDVIADAIRIRRAVGPTDMEDASEVATPAVYELHQNYPNPFNPQTTIPFRLNKPAKVRLQLFNSAGQRVKTLIDGNLQAGSHSTRLNGQTLASGVYFYRIEVSPVSGGRQSSIRKMILLH